MMGQLIVLHRVKALKEDQALRAVEAKRRQVAEGKAAVARAEEIEAESRRTLVAREDAVYEGIMGRVVDRDMLEDTRAAVVAMEKQHTQLVDAVSRSVHVLARLDSELAGSVAVHHSAVKVRDNYALLLDERRIEAASAAEALEESEIEELFAKPQRRPA